MTTQGLNSLEFDHVQGFDEYNLNGLTYEQSHRVQICLSACSGILRPEALPEAIEAFRNARNLLAALSIGEIKSIGIDDATLRRCRQALISLGLTE